jgi:hypothetical protein
MSRIKRETFAGTLISNWQGTRKEYTLFLILTNPNPKRLMGALAITYWCHCERFPGEIRRC